MNRERSSLSHPATGALFQNLPRQVLAPVPLFLLQPLLGRIVRQTAIVNPGMFSRLGVHKNKKFLIDPVNMPFTLLLCPDPEAPKLRAYRRTNTPDHDARITGTFLTLMDMVDGRTDGDALFFTRDLMVDGDTEATVVLRNTLDDLDSTVIDAALDALGPLGRPARLLRKARHQFKDKKESVDYDVR